MSHITYLVYVLISIKFWKFWKKVLRLHFKLHWRWCTTVNLVAPGANRLLVRRRSDHHANCIPKFTKSEEEMIPIRKNTGLCPKRQNLEGGCGTRKGMYQKVVCAQLFNFYVLSLITLYLIKRITFLYSVFFLSSCSHYKWVKLSVVSKPGLFCFIMKHIFSWQSQWSRSGPVYVRGGVVYLKVGNKL